MFDNYEILEKEKQNDPTQSKKKGVTPFSEHEHRQNWQYLVGLLPDFCSKIELKENNNFLNKKKCPYFFCFKFEVFN